MPTMLICDSFIFGNDFDEINVEVWQVGNQLDKLYCSDFYSGLLPGMTSSAEVVLGLLYEHFKPVSVIDVGCGQGSWLREAEKLGSTRLMGLDGPWVRKSELLSSNIDFQPVNFESEIPKIAEKFDLCISLEVAEHISSELTSNFINLLCSSSDIILFSAAIKSQGGTNHINERWQSEWLEMFKERGFESLDVFRNKIWNNPAVEWWYSQNVFLLVGPDNCKLNVSELKAQEKGIVDVVHPANYESKVRYFEDLRENPSLRFCLSCFFKYLKKNLITKLTKKKAGKAAS